MSLLKDLLLFDILSGLKVTFQHFLPAKWKGRPSDTVEYPEQAREPAARFRGMFKLDEERCIKCTLCALECPINIIYIDWHNETNPQTQKKEKVLDRFDLDMKRCMFCGLCEEACPTNPKSIWLRTKTYELSTYERNEDLYLTIEKMTAWNDKVKAFRNAPEGAPPEK